MDSAKYVTHHKRININIGKKKIKSKMCNKIKCAIQYAVDLINNNIRRNVQGCTRYIHITAIQMMENSEYLTVY